jgi:hypothetical protein
MTSLDFRRLRLRLLILLPILLASVALAQTSRRAAPLPQLKLVDVVMRNFDAWDENHDGILQEKEIDAAVLNPAVKGDDAAAAAALHNFIFQEHAADRSVVVSKDWLTTSKQMATTRPTFNGVIPAALDAIDPITPPGATTPGSNTPGVTPPGVTPPALDRKPSPAVHEAPTTRLAAAATRPTSRPVLPRPIITPQGFFDGARRVLARGEHRLYVGDGPAFDKIRQGGLGDCYLISVIGARTWFDAAKMQSMITLADEDRYVVHWGDGTTTEVPPLSDGELAAGGAQMSGGLWVRVMEKALAWRKVPEDQRDETVAGSAIGKGGNTRMVTMLITGHHADSARLFEGRTPTQGNIDMVLKRVRPELVKAMADKRLVTLSTLAAPLPPPGMSPKHAYAIIKYDDKEDRVTIWNPHANTFAPHLPEGINNGYVTRGGVFSMSLTECAKIFGSISWETPDALKPGELKIGPATRPAVPK